MIKTTPESLRAKASQVLDKGTEMKTTTDKMFDLVDSINGAVWTGQSQAAYTNQFEELRDDSQRMFETVQRLSEDLNAIAAEYQKAEEETMNISQNLATEVFY